MSQPLAHHRTQDETLHRGLLDTFISPHEGGTRQACMAGHSGPRRRKSNDLAIWPREAYMATRGVHGNLVSSNLDPLGKISTQCKVEPSQNGGRQRHPCERGHALPVLRHPSSGHVLSLRRRGLPAPLSAGGHGRPVRQRPAVQPLLPAYRRGLLGRRCHVGR